MGYLEGGHDGHTMSEQREGEEKRSPRIQDAKKEMELCITGSGIVGGGRYRTRSSDVDFVARFTCRLSCWNLFSPLSVPFPFALCCLITEHFDSFPPAFLCSFRLSYDEVNK